MTFVEEFVGPERGLKRLALIGVGDIEVEEGPVVDPSATVEEARAMIEKFGFGWTSVVDDGELLGWVDADSLDGRLHVRRRRRPVPSARTSPQESSLRQALDSIVTSRTNVAVVATEGQHYRGILTLERITQEILS